MNAQIKRLYMVDPLTGNAFACGYEWEGEPDWPISLCPFDDPPDSYPWLLHKVAEDSFGYEVTYLREDCYGYAIARFQADALRAHTCLQLVGARLIWTAAVWGLAYIPQGYIPSWRHLGKRRIRTNA